MAASSQIRAGKHAAVVVHALHTLGVTGVTHAGQGIVRVRVPDGVSGDEHQATLIDVGTAIVADAARHLRVTQRYGAGEPPTPSGGGRFTIAKFLNGSLHTINRDYESFTAAVNSVTEDALKGHEVPDVKYASTDHTHAWLDEFGARHDAVVMEGNITNLAVLYARAGIEI